MNGWAVVIAWSAAVVLAIVVLGFCGYEIRWKLSRLRADLEQLRALEVPARDLADQLAAAQLRLAQAQSRLSHAGTS